MHRTSTFVIAVAVLGGLLVSGGTAGAHDEGRVTGTISLSGTTAVNRIESVHGEELDNDPRHVRGYIRASREIGQANGPIICLDIRGNTAGAIYRIDDGFPADTVVYATAIDNGPGEQDYVGFTGPLPAPVGALHCAPQPSLNVFPLQGDAVITDLGHRR